MFDLRNIDFIKTDAQHGRKAYSFVGLKRKENSDRLEFWLPLGFDDFETGETISLSGAQETSNFERVKKFFFKMYRTFHVYRGRKLNKIRENEITDDRDGIFEFENGFSFINKNDEQVIFYGKLNALDKILEGYDELRISSLEKKQIRSIEIDYSKIHRYMHQAIYLKNDVIYLDEMTVTKDILIQESPPIIQLFCFIYTEIKKELEETNSIADKAFELAEKFKETHLQSASSLFAESTFADTISILKNVFEDIDNKTTYKDADFWHFYDAIEAFLMSERENDSKGIYFGISNFYDVWEDLCQSYMLSQSEHLSRVLFADVKGRLLTRKNLNLSPELEENPFKIKINGTSKERFLRPDLVLGSLNYEKAEDIFEIIQSKQGWEVSFLNYQNTENNHKRIIELYKKYGKFIPNHNKEGKMMVIFTKERITLFKNAVFAYLNGNKKDALNLDLSTISIIDYKYMRKSDYQNYNPTSIDEKGENKVTSDIHKQLIYEWTVQKNFESSHTQSEFWIPYYSENLKFTPSKQEVDITNQFFLLSKIKIIKINFRILQEHYIKLAITV